MKISRFAMVLLILPACEIPPNEGLKQEVIFVSSLSDQATEPDKININLAKSVVRWKGTKLLGAGSHSGRVNFKEGFLLFTDDKIVGGEFIVDMSSIYNTDIPLSDPVPRRNLTEHLNSDFETGKYPTSRFKISMADCTSNECNIKGQLTIKDISREINFLAIRKSRNAYFTTFTFNRFDWKIGENGTWLEKKLVDDDITLEIEIATK